MYVSLHVWCNSSTVGIYIYSGYITATGMAPIKLCYAALVIIMWSIMFKKGVEFARERKLVMILGDVGMTVPKSIGTVHI